MKPAVLCFLVAVFCLAQTPSPPAAISAYYRLPGATTFPYQWLIIDPPLSLSFDGTSPHLSATPLSAQSDGATVGTFSTINIVPGYGVVSVPQISNGVLSIQSSFDPAKMAYRVSPPVASGACVDPATNLPYGAGAWAADGSYFYICVPVASDPPNNGTPPSFIWARTGLVTQW